jgi:group I intron endonuclease
LGYDSIHNVFNSNSNNRIKLTTQSRKFASVHTKRAYSTKANLDSTLSPVVSYENADLLKDSIIKQNKGKSGVYCLKNLVNGKSYVGSSANLGNRLQNYFHYSYLTNPKNRSLINRALLKYGYANFKVEILGYCGPSEVLNIEQHFMDILHPEYNLRPTASSPLGYKHTDEARANISRAQKNKVYTEQQINFARNLNKLRSPELIEIISRRMSEINLARAHSIEVINTTTGLITIYPSIRKAAAALGVDPKVIRNCLQNKKIYKTYIFSKVVKED